MRSDASNGTASDSKRAAPSAVVVSPISASPPPPPPLSPPSPLVLPPLQATLSAVVDDGSENPDEGQETRANAYQRKRAERMFSCESMKDLDRDLRITGVTKKGSSWQYHIEVLDTRVRMPSFTDPGSLTLSPSRERAAGRSSSNADESGANPVGDGDDASYAELPPMVRYSVMRRYNDFRQLYMYLSDTYGLELLETLPKFPEGGILSYIRGDDPRLLKYRKEQLQKFLRALDEHPHLKYCKGVTHFLRPDILELTTIGGMFQSNAESSASTGFLGGDGNAPQPPTSSSGYVSLSMVRSPEIRFSKQLPTTDGRGDWKRRRVPFPAWGSDSETATKTKKRVSLTEEEDDDEEENDENDDERMGDRKVDDEQRKRRNLSEQQQQEQQQEQQHEQDGGLVMEQKKATQLMKMLSLDAPATQ